MLDGRRAAALPVFLMAALVLLPVCYARAQAFATYDIPSQDVASALRAFAEASDLRLIAPANDLKGITSRPLKGQFRPSDALVEMLRDTGLEAQITPTGFVSVKAAQRRKPAEGSERPSLQPIAMSQGEPAVAESSQAAAPSGEAESSAPALAEVIVTSRRQAERLQDLPLNVTAFTREALARKNVMNIFDLSNLTPNLNFENLGFRNGQFLTIRSLNSGGAGGGRASVFIDGIYVAPPGNYESVPFAALERVEVLKGPQSALYGRATFSGAVNYVLKSPGETVEGHVDYLNATLDEQVLNAFVSGPLVSDRLFGSLSYYYMTFGGPGTWTNRRGGHPNGSQQTDAVSAKLIGKVNDDWQVTGRASYSEDDDGNWVTLYIDPAARNFSVRRPDGSTGRYVQGVVPTPCFCNLDYGLANLSHPGIRRSQWRTSVSVNGEVAGHTLDVTGAYNRQRERGETDLSAAPFPAFRSVIRTLTRDESVDVRVSSRSDRPVRYSFGGYYLHLRNNNTGFLVFDIFGGTVSSNPSLAETKDRSAYAAAYIDFGSRSTLSLEGRYQSERLTTTNTATLLSFSTVHKSFLPRVNLDFRPIEPLLLYAVYSEGTTPGSFNVGRVANEGQRVVQPEELRNYEIGAKSVWFDNRLKVNAAAYVMDWKNLISSATYTTPSGLPAPIQENRGLARVTGGEVEAEALLGRGVDMRVAVSHNDAEYRRNCSTNAGTLFGRSDLPAPTRCLFFNGATLEGQIPTQASLALGYTGHLRGEWQWYSRGEVMYAAGQWADDMNLARSGSATTANFRIGATRGNLNVELLCRNCTDEDVYTRAIIQTDYRVGTSSATGMSVGGTARRPRQFGIKVSADF